MRTITRTFILGWLLSLGACERQLTASRPFNGVVTTFRIENPVVQAGQDLKVEVVYTNTGDQTVTFHYPHPDEDAEIYRQGTTELVQKQCLGTAPYFDVILKPSESARFEESVTLHCWRDLTPGRYEIRFFYHLGLLFNESLAQLYQSKYPHDGYVVAWEDRSHSFRVAK